MSYRLRMILAIVCVILSPHSFAQEDFGLYIDGVRIDDGVTGAEKEVADAALADFAKANDLNLSEAAKLIDAIEKGGVPLNNVPPVFRGLSGAVTMQALKILVLNVTSPNPMTGKIQSWNYAPDGQDVNGQDRGRGEFIIDMPCIIAGKPEILRWHVRVHERGYKVVKRNDDAHNDLSIDPFPGTMTLPAAIRAPGGNNGDNIWDRKLTHKVYAAGTTIEVLKVEHSADGQSFSPLSPQDYPAYYASTGASCVDMLLDNTPAKYLDHLPDQKGYCLGRCVYPPIVNSS